jgi:hypothetical protein
MSAPRITFDAVCQATLFALLKEPASSLRNPYKFYAILRELNLPRRDVRESRRFGSPPVETLVGLFERGRALEVRSGA